MFIQAENFAKIAPYTQLFIQGILVTVLLSVFTVLIGFCIALVLALMRMSNVCPFRSLGLDKDGHMREAGLIRCPSLQRHMSRFFVRLRFLYRSLLFTMESSAW